MGTVAEYLANQRKQEWLQEGILKGMQQGRQEGIQKGELLILTKLLQRKFGNLPIHYREQLESANSVDLLRWSERLLEVNSLEELFEEIINLK